MFESGTHSRRRRTSALLTAVRCGHYDTVEAVLLLNGDVNVADHKGRRPLHLAIKRSVNNDEFGMSCVSFKWKDDHFTVALNGCVLLFLKPF